MNEPFNEMPKLSQLEPLMSNLNTEQQLQLRQALVRQAIHYVSQELPPNAIDDGHRQGCNRAAEWLENPTAEVAHNAYMWAVGECWDGGVRYFDYPEYSNLSLQRKFTEPLYVNGILLALMTARSHCRLVRPMELPEKRRLHGNESFRSASK